jgi:hypothetical protein
MKRQQQAIKIAALVSVALWVIPGAAYLMLPLIYLNVHIHELCHALAAVLTGGSVQHIVVFAAGNGVTPVSGGSLLIVAMAGYLGATAVGGAIILYSRTENSARLALKVVAGLLAFSLFVWVRGDIVGVISGVFWVAILWLAATRLKGDQLLFAAQFVGIQQCLNSIQSVLTLYKLSVIGETQSDAGILGDATGTSPIFWSVLWCGFSAVIIFASLRRVWRPESRKG